MAANLFTSFVSKAAAHHATYITKFYNKKLAGVGSFVGASCGLIYLTEYYGRRTWNDAAGTWNDILCSEERLTKTIDFGFFTIDRPETDDEYEERMAQIVKFKKLKKYRNPFSVVIFPRAPFSINLFTTMITGGVMGCAYAVYWPAAIPLTIAYNLATYTDDSNDSDD
jgi:hypothetical protein